MLKANCQNQHKLPTMSQFSKNVTFQTFPYPPPPPPPLSDQEFLKQYESKIVPPKPRKKINKYNVLSLRFDLLNLITAFRDMKNQEEMLHKNSKEFTDDEWKSAMESIETNKAVVQRTFMMMTGSFIAAKRKFLQRRAAKRRRLQRISEEYQDWRDLYIDKKSERSLRIDENLHKINEGIQRARQEEEAKREADMVLKDVLRKKHDAKKSIAKLEALLKLKQARLNTAKGKGQSVSENDTAAFQTYIENLKSLWICKLSSYEKEESELRKDLEVWKKDLTANLLPSDHLIKKNLAGWQRALFGIEGFPQADFKGDLGEFIRVRSEWDRYIDNGPESTPLPVGWVVNTKKRSASA